MTFNLADLFEAAVDAFGDREYLVAAGKRRTYAEMEARANRLAHYPGRPGDRARATTSASTRSTASSGWRRPGRCSSCGPSGSTSTTATSKDELRYLFTNADLVALVHQASSGPRWPSCCPSSPTSDCVVSIDDGSGRAPRPGRRPLRGGGGLGRAPSGTSPPGPATTSTSSTPAAPPACPRASSGATRTSSTRSAVASTRTPTPGWSGPRRWSRRARAASSPCCPSPRSCTGPPSGAVMGQSFVGNRIILVPKFDPHEVWRLVGDREGQLRHDHR